MYLIFRFRFLQKPNKPFLHDQKNNFVLLKDFVIFLNLNNLQIFLILDFQVNNSIQKFNVTFSKNKIKNNFSKEANVNFSRDFKLLKIN